MNGTNATKHRTIPRHIQIHPYNRREAHRTLEIEIDQAMQQLQQQPLEPHKLSFCKGTEICAYATANCIYGMKDCYFE